MKLSQELKSKIFNIADQKIDDIFCEAHLLAKTNSGDISPSDSFYLDQISNQLKLLVCHQISYSYEE